MKKLTVEFSDGMTSLLDNLAKERGTTKVDIIRRALALYNYVSKEAFGKKDQKLVITGKDDEVIKEIVLIEKA